MLKKEDIKNGTVYWYCLAYFKHSSGQLSKTHRLQKPMKVNLEPYGSNEIRIINSETKVRITHPNYYSFSCFNSTAENYFGNFIFVSEEEAWEYYYKQINKEIERIDDLVEKRKSLYTSFLIK